MALAKRIAPVARNLCAVLGLAACLAIPGDPASAQPDSAWNSYYTEDPDVGVCELVGGFSTASNPESLGRVLSFTTWMDDYSDWDEDFIGTTRQSDARVQPAGANGSTISVVFPLRGHSQTYEVDFRSEDYKLRLRNRDLFDELVAEARQPGGGSAEVVFRFANGDLLGRLQLHGFLTAVESFRDCVG
ncbi:MAG: hypothetical protein KDK12_17670 [Rhodobacteraceae bacterium]|nr:hypothetical protein [Paracoccaceae bacterium]